MCPVIMTLDVSSMCHESSTLRDSAFMISQKVVFCHIQYQRNGGWLCCFLCPALHETLPQPCCRTSIEAVHLVGTLIIQLTDTYERQYPSVVARVPDAEGGRG